MCAYSKLRVNYSTFCIAFSTNYSPTTMLPMAWTKPLTCLYNIAGLYTALDLYQAHTSSPNATPNKRLNATPSKRLSLHQIKATQRQSGHYHSFSASSHPLHSSPSTSGGGWTAGGAHTAHTHILTDMAHRICACENAFRGTVAKLPGTWSLVLVPGLTYSHSTPPSTL